MAKLPKYMKLGKMEYSKETKGLTLTISVKRWGWPVILFNFLHECKNLPWWKWLVYPKICLRALICGVSYD